MYVDGENPNPETSATNQAAVDQSTAVAAAAPAPATETPAYPDHHHDVAQIDNLESRVIAILEQFGVTDKFMVEIEAAVARELEARIDNLKADILAHLVPMLKEIVGKSAPPSAAPVSAAAAPRVLAAGDPVRVYKDADHKTFYTGEIVTVHDGGHAADVKIAELDGAVSTVRVESLEYDDRR